MRSNEYVDQLLAQAKEAIHGQPTLGPRPDLPEHINTRLRIAADVAQDNVAKIDPATSTDANRLIQQSLRSKTRSQRFTWLMRAADRMGKAASEHSACKKGCSHCCHIPVKITQAEAQDIGQRIGVAPAPIGSASGDAISQYASEEVRVGYGSPCPFLLNDACSIYENRPVVCRGHLNMDSDDLLCRLIEGQAVPVPYLNTSVLSSVSLMISGESPLADIRAWFPQGMTRQSLPPV